MRKEVIIAIILGLVLGSVLVYGIYTANKAATSVIRPTQETATNQEETVAQTELLTITTPLDGDIFSTPVATISGQTDPQNALVIITENDQFTPETDQDGNFILEIKLIKGGNLIQITAITPTGQRRDEYLNLVYTVTESTTKQ